MASVTSTPVRTTPFPSWPRFGPEELTGLSEVLESGIWSDANGPAVQVVQTAYAEFTQTKYAVAVTNGTVAIVLSLRALGIGAGD